MEHLVLSFANSSFRYFSTFARMSSGCCGGTSRKLNLPPTEAGMTVFAPTPENAPSMPWIESEGLRMRAMMTVLLSSETAM